MNAAKLEMIDDNRSDLDRFVHDLVDGARDPELVGPPQPHDPHDVWTLDSLAGAFSASKERRPSEKALGHALKRAGAKNLGRLRIGTQLYRPWAVGGAEYWANTGADEVKNALETTGRAKEPKF